jgi:hypothetical protein
MDETEEIIDATAATAGYDPTVCITRLTAAGLTPICEQLSLPYHCDVITGLNPNYHQMCAQGGIYYFPIIVIVCFNSATKAYQYFPSNTVIRECVALSVQDPSWVISNCYCCCSCLANDTLIAVPDGFAPIYTIPAGALVIAGSVAQDSSELRVNWAELTVSFSQGTGEGGEQPMMVYIAYGADKNQELICSMDQPFLLADGKFTTGGKLRPGQQLVDRDGQPQEIGLVSVGAYHGGVHHIATVAPWVNSPDGHLLLAGGVVAGDWAMQMHFVSLPASLKESNYDYLPYLGTKEYEDTHQGMQASQSLFEFTTENTELPGAGQRQMAAGLFKTYRKAEFSVPFGAQSLLTEAQSLDVLMKGTQSPISDPIPQSLFNSITAQLAGFYPDIIFYYDALDMMPNVYAFEAYGQKIVQVSGGLGRLKGFSYEGMFMAMSHGVACFEGGPPTNAWGYSAVGQADSFAFAIIARLCWIGSPYLTYVMAALRQWQALFALVSAANAGGNPADPLNDPSLACRIEAIQSAIGGGALPECAGGQPQPMIRLEQAASPSANKVVLVLSLAVDPTSASDVSNYSFNPVATVTSAKVDKSTGFTIYLEADLEAGKSYEVTISNLSSILGTGVDPNNATAQFNAATA